jgi:hypothetical protein
MTKDTGKNADTHWRGIVWKPLQVNNQHVLRNFLLEICQCVTRRFHSVVVTCRIFSYTAKLIIYEKEGNMCDSK